MNPTTTEITESVQPIVKKIFTGTCVVIMFILLYKLGISLYQKKTAYDLAKKNTTCPTLLSISRSARDTLLVMKSESLCTTYVLDNIK